MNKTSTICFVLYYMFTMSRTVLLIRSIKLPNTMHKLVWHTRLLNSPLVFLLCPDHCAGRSVLPTEPLKKQGDSAVAMAAQEAPWRMTSASYLLTQAHHKHTNGRPHPPTLEDHSCTSQPRQSQQYAFSETHSKSDHCSPAKHAYILVLFAPTHTFLQSPPKQQWNVHATEIIT